MNAWRSENPDIRPNLMGADLNGENLSGQPKDRIGDKCLVRKPEHGTLFTSPKQSCSI
jgi:hypothetical protein